MARKGLTYAQAGVSRIRGDRLVDHIAPLARKTLRPEVITSVGGFASLAELPSGYREPLLVTSTDGVGTKVMLANRLKTYDTVGIDLVAMSVNDVLTLGAEPFLFLDYFATGELKLKVGRDLVKGVAKGCQQAGCALVGGETAEMPHVYRKDDFDLAGFCVGIVEKSEMLDGSQVKPGDLLAGIPSSGLHSNGYSLVHAILKKKKLNLGRKVAPLTEPLGKALLRPTRIYVKEVLPLVKLGYVRAMAHITGGGIEGNLPRVLPRGVKAEVIRGSWRIPPIFRFLSEAGQISRDEMYRTFNMGIGFILVIDKRVARKVTQALSGSRIIGEIKKTRSRPHVIWRGS